MFFVDVKLTVFAGEAGEIPRKYKSWGMGASAGFRDVLESAAVAGGFDLAEGIRVGGGGRRQDGVAWARSPG
ncbi:hypothetical protein ASD89_09000 [Caulobacter sp. Root656]|nr:hypothetical protein ASD89_09000 [Caulobacter sp. Root656]